jgi:hypothetical protein
MKTQVSVERQGSNWAILDRGKVISTIDGSREKWVAELAAHHYRHAPSLLKTLRLKKCENGYHGRPYWGVDALVSKTDNGNWSLSLIVDDHDRGISLYPTRQAALEAIVKVGSETTKTVNILNPEAGEFDISRSEKGGCCDPSTETYHCM